MVNNIPDLKKRMRLASIRGEVQLFRRLKRQLRQLQQAQQASQPTQAEAYQNL